MVIQIIRAFLFFLIEIEQKAAVLGSIQSFMYICNLISDEKSTLKDLIAEAKENDNLMDKMTILSAVLTAGESRFGKGADTLKDFVLDQFKDFIQENSALNNEDNGAGGVDVDVRSGDNDNTN